MRGGDSPRAAGRAAVRGADSRVDSRHGGTRTGRQSQGGSTLTPEGEPTDCDTYLATVTAPSHATVADAAGSAEKSLQAWSAWPAQDGCASGRLAVRRGSGGAAV